VIAVFFAPLFFWMLESVSTRFGGKEAAPAPAQGSAPAPAQGGAAPAAAPHAKREGD
jgi:multidrug efflux pump